MNKNMKRKVMPSMELLSEMECLEIHGGAGQTEGIDINVYCNGAKCVESCTIEKKSVQCALNLFCGDNPNCLG